MKFSGKEYYINFITYQKTMQDIINVFFALFDQKVSIFKSKKILGRFFTKSSPIFCKEQGIKQAP
jgi:hypothetical protein